MSDPIGSTSVIHRFPSLRGVLSRWGFPRNSAGSMLAPVTAVGRRPGAAVLPAPVSIEVSPAMVDPFPEPKTIPGGWDMSELVKSK